MEELTGDQLFFLKCHRISLEKVFNAYGLSTSSYKEQMEQKGMLIAYNVTPCKNYGHTLRTRGGHCFQCNPASIGYLKRHDSPGYVYIAESKKHKLLKVGFTENYFQRENSLTSEAYANIVDWEIIYVINSASAGKIESDIKTQLYEYSTSEFYDHDDKIQEAKELYKCEIIQVIEAIKVVCVERGFTSSIVVSFE
jgi:hypothetical protein